MDAVREATRFGIEPDTGENTADRIRAFIRDGLNEGVRVFRFKRGRYEIADAKAIQDFETLMAGNGSWDLGDDTESKNVLIRAEGIERIVLDFQGSTLMCHGLIQPFCFKNCSRVEIRNVVVDWSRPPFSQGRIVSVDEDGFEIEFDSEYPVRSGIPVAGLIDYIPGSDYPLRGTVDWFHIAERTELTGPQTLRVTLKESPRARMREGGGGNRAVPGIGMSVIVRHVMNYKAAFLFYGCDRVELENATVYAAPGMGVIGHNCGDVSMRELRVMRRPGSGRIMSANTDATHFIGCMGTIEFDDCLFEGMGDDATNVHGFYLGIRERKGDDTLLCGVDADIQSECPEVPVVGDTIEFTSRRDLQPYATLHVREVETDEDGGIALRFKEPLPERFSVEDLLANASRIAKLRFRDSLVRNNRARAILVQTRDAEISGNTFDHCTGTAIHVNCADGWKESISTANVMVTRNEFLSCGFGAGTYRKTSALAVMTESERAGLGTHRSFAFTDNFIRGNGAVAVRLESLDTALVRGNRFEEAGEAVSIDEASCERVVVEE
ncbi:right-handed parallel beta-helix repeat-containing protein [Cohnella phaseoli]|uniref:Parallel beta helix pectate lyase-like protein n=1 Tax=Cohnella phaseoli TaxID=456490 RepID=A0A3D9KG80_9BACL|nr:right-handed parallel beta-helix repeat-containing protein [Cohnella phaseoli]RED85379.1 parallel beta helix pectate lyase-like protein [Cohnella phaseoli]